MIKKKTKENIYIFVYVISDFFILLLLLKVTNDHLY